jgi:hypothetical protein
MSQYIKSGEKHETKGTLVLVVRRKTAVLTDKDLRKYGNILGILDSAV